MNKKFTLLEKNTTLRSECQIFEDCTQVVFWLESFNKPWSICYQNGDMNGEKKGTAVGTNCGADTGIDELIDILSERSEFDSLYDTDTYDHMHQYRTYVIQFIEYLADKYDVHREFADL